MIVPGTWALHPCCVSRPGPPGASASTGRRPIQVRGMTNPGRRYTLRQYSLRAPGGVGSRKRDHRAARRLEARPVRAQIRSAGTGGRVLSHPSGGRERCQPARRRSGTGVAAHAQNVGSGPWGHPRFTHRTFLRRHGFPPGVTLRISRTKRGRSRSGTRPRRRGSRA